MITESRILIAGFGNSLMADDGVGPTVVSHLLEKGLPPHVRAVTVDGDPLALWSLWAGEPEVWLVDAVDGDAPPGTLRLLDHDAVMRLPSDALTTHHLSMGDCLRWLVHARPEMEPVRFRLLGVEAASVHPGTGAAPAVAEAVVLLVEQLLEAAEKKAP